MNLIRNVRYNEELQLDLVAWETAFRGNGTSYAQK